MNPYSPLPRRRLNHARYDSLGRLTSEFHPEWGSGSTTTYGYNSDSLLTSRVRPAPNQTNPAVSVSTNYGYDPLHRLTSRTYTGDPSGTPSAAFNYDESSVWSQALNNTIGRMSSGSSGSTGQVFSYDTVGRVVSNWQCTPRTCGGTPYLLSYVYDLAGNVTSASNGAGVTFTYTYNTAPRLTAMTSSLVDAQHPATLLSNVHYGPFGAVSDSLGNGLAETIRYTSRGMLQSYTSTPYSFSLTGLAGNGTITAGNDSVNGNWTYAYDQFNRLMTSSKSTVPAQGFNYVYDRYGNRWQQNLTQGTGPTPQYAFDSATNRISGSGITYDALGNETNDGFHSYTYDAESRLIRADGGATATYTYDAEGRRIRNASSEFVYDLAGHAITLFGATNGIWNYGEIYTGGRHLATYSGSTTSFLHTDWLGTKRIMTNVSGTNSETCTGLPFGDGASCTGTDWGFSHFTDDVHDGETNTEHAWFRQLSTTQGRWLRPDPYLGSIDLANPQSMNRYAYVLDSPVNLTDSLGLKNDCGGPCTPFVYVDSSGCLISVYYTEVTGIGGIKYDDPHVDTICQVAVAGPPQSGVTVGTTPTVPAGNCVMPTWIQRIGIPIQATASKFWNKTIGLGLGASASGGVIAGTAYSFSRQIVTSPNGQAAFVTTITDPAYLPFNAAVMPGAGGYLGLQYSFSNAQSPQDLEGAFLNGGAGGGLGFGGGLDGALGSGTNGQVVWQANVTVGAGAGGKGAAIMPTTSFVTPICSD